MDASSRSMASAVVVPDGVPVGSEVRFESTRVRFHFEERSGALDDFRAPDGMVLGLLAGRAEFTEIHGNAVLVAPGIALCATHVVEPYFGLIPTGELQLMCFAVASHGVNLWRVKHVTTSRFADISFLAVEPASQVPPSAKYRQAAISTRFPAVGERLLCLGFRADQEAFPTPQGGAPDTPKHLHFHGQVIASAGKVTQQFPAGRDRLTLPWPSLEADFPAWGGMSGGPVFDSEGCLVGLLCRSWSTEGEPSPSYVAHVYPVLLDRFKRDWPQFVGAREFVSLLEIDPRLCDISGREAVTATPDGGLGYRFWS